MLYFIVFMFRVSGLWLFSSFSVTIFDSKLIIKETRFYLCELRVENLAAHASFDLCWEFVRLLCYLLLLFEVVVVVRFKVLFCLFVAVC